MLWFAWNKRKDRVSVNMAVKQGWAPRLLFGARAAGFIFSQILDTWCFNQVARCQHKKAARACAKTNLNRLFDFFWPGMCAAGCN